MTLLVSGSTAGISRGFARQCSAPSQDLGTVRRDRVVGSMLRVEDVTANPRLNFLNDAALGAADRRAVDVQAEGGTLEEHRLRHNMLSSMPMCFNIFGALEGTDGAIDLMRELFDPAMTSLDRMICEITPAKTLGDRTAFDAMIDYTTGSGPAFVGIETKYTEPFSQNLYESDTYRMVTEASSWFPPATTWRRSGCMTSVGNRKSGQGRPSDGR